MEFEDIRGFILWNRSRDIDFGRRTTNYGVEWTDHGSVDWTDYFDYTSIEHEFCCIFVEFSVNRDRTEFSIDFHF